MKKNVNAKQAIRILAARKGVAVEEVRRQIKLAIFAGLCSQDPAVQARWKKIPCKNEVPTPEEVIAYLAENVHAGIDLLA